MKQNWIWLDPALYPDARETAYTGWCDTTPRH